VDVRVDATGHDEFAADIERLRGFWQDARRGYRHDLFALDTDVPGPNALWGHHLATVYQ
jgi:hypothetical protein